MNVYNYARWSSDQQTKGDSLRRQSQLARNWCASRGLALTDSARDEGVSAWNGKNRADGSGLSRLLKRVQPGDFLLIEDSDRLSREDWLTHMNFLRDITAKGCTVVTLSNGNEIDSERFRNNPGCFLQAVLSAHLGHSENEKKSQRIKESWRARYAKLANGQVANLHFPNWLAWDSTTDKPVVVESNAVVIRRMFALALHGAGCLTIARQLHREGFKLMAGDRRLALSSNYVWRCLRNELTIGTNIYTEPNVPKIFPAIIDERTFFAVQGRMETNKHETHHRTGSVPSLFSGLAFCSRCGRAVTRFTQCRNAKKYHYLTCSDSLHGRGNCQWATTRYDAVEKSFLHLLGESDLVRQAMADQQPVHPTLLDSLSGQLAASDQQVSKLMKLIADDPNPSVSVYTAIKSQEEKSAELRQQIEAERGRQWSERTTPLESYVQFCREFENKMERPQYRESVRSMLRNFVDRIIVELGKDRYTVQFKAAKQAVEVTLNRNGWVYSPDPSWVLGRPVPEKRNVIG